MAQSSSLKCEWFVRWVGVLLAISDVPSSATLPPWSRVGGQAASNFGYSTRTAGDVNGDGFSDLIVGVKFHATAGVKSGRAVVFHGSPHGLSPEPDWIADGEQADAEFGYAVSGAGDVNGDGCDDVLVGAFRFTGTHTNAGRVYLYLGSKDGLKPRADVVIDGEASDSQLGIAVAGAGDINGDGFDDVVVGAWHHRGSQERQGKATLYLGSRHGLVIPQAWSALGGQAGEEYGYCVAGIGDINGDGLADFAVGSRRFSGNWRNEGKVSVYYGSRAGPPWEPDWSAKGGQEDASFGESIAAAGDVNGDGIGDLLVGAFTWDGSQVDEGRAYLYLGSKDGPPGRPDWTAEGGALNARFGFSLATAGDVNRDGYADVIIGAFGFKSDLDGGRAFVFHGSPTGLGRSPAASFAARQGLASCGISVGTAGDVDRDGFADVVVGASAFDQSLPDEGKVWVLHGSPSGITAETAPHDSSISTLRFQTVPGLGTGPKPTALATGDFNRDGWPDLAAVSQGAHALHLFLGRGDGRFRAQPPVRIGKDPQALVVNDFNDDDIPDIATAAHSGTISVLLGDGHGGLQVANEYHVDLGPVGLAAADFDRDAIMDLAIVVEAGPDGRMLKGIGRGKFVEAGPITLRHEPHAAIAMDMDGDHQPDLVVANYNSSSVSVRRGRVGAELGERVDYRVGLTPKALASVDFNRDGRPDLVTANYAGETVTLLVGEADGSLRRADDFLVPGNPAAIVTADFDADGLSDLATANAGSGSVSILLGSRHGYVTSPQPWVAGRNPSGLVVTDFDGDGQPDVAVIDALENTFSVLLNRTHSGWLRHFWDLLVSVSLAMWGILAGVGAGAAIAAGLTVRFLTLRKTRRRIHELELSQVVAKERARIARDIHDDLGASLTRIQLLSSLAASRARQAGEVRDPLEAIARIARDVTLDMDEIVWAVNPKNDSLEDLADYLGQWAVEFLRHAGLRCILELPESLPAVSLEAAQRHALFLVVKECLQNIVKHARASEVSLRLAFDRQVLRLEIEDDGVGFETASSARRPSGDGLANIQSRVAQLGGSVRWQSQMDQGTTVEVCVPLEIDRSSSAT